MNNKTRTKQSIKQISKKKSAELLNNFRTYKHSSNIKLFLIET